MIRYHLSSSIKFLLARAYSLRWKANFEFHLEEPHCQLPIWQLALSTYDTLGSTIINWIYIYHTEKDFRIR